MYEKAVEKLTNEMNENENNSYVQAIGQFLLEHLKDHPEKAESILSEDKTILKSLEVAHRYAGTKRVGNAKVVALRDDEVFAVVLTYFGCPDGDPIELPPEPERPVATPATVGPTLHNTKATSSKRIVGTKGIETSDKCVQVSLF